jgi:hypothetical protein
MRAGGEVSSTNNELPKEEEPDAEPKHNHYGSVALTLWTLALMCSVVDATLAFDRIKVLILTGGLLLMDIAGAILASAWWFTSRNVISPMNDYRIALQYGYSAGYADGYADAPAPASLSPVVHISSRRVCGGLVSANGSNRGNVDDHVS